MSQAHLNSIRAVGGALKIQPAAPNKMPAPAVPIARPIAAALAVMNCVKLTAMKALRFFSTTRDIISVTSAGLALGKPKHCRTCSHRMRETVGVPIMPEHGSGTLGGCQSPTHRVFERVHLHRSTDRVCAESHAFCNCRVNFLFNIDDLSGHAEETHSVVADEFESLCEQMFHTYVVV